MLHMRPCRTAICSVCEFEASFYDDDVHLPIDSDLCGLSKDADSLIGLTVSGPHLKFRQAAESDAAFILALRLDPHKNAYLSPVNNDIAAQAAWISRAANDAGQLYFIIEADGRPVGTVRLYDRRGRSFCWGSWVLVEDAPKSSAVESTLMVYSLGLHLRFETAHFEVRKGNVKVWQYHERLGAQRVSEDDENFHYVMSNSAIMSVLDHYGSRGPVRINMPQGEADTVGSS